MKIKITPNPNGENKANVLGEFLNTLSPEAQVEFKDNVMVVNDPVFDSVEQYNRYLDTETDLGLVKMPNEQLLSDLRDDGSYDNEDYIPDDYESMPPEEYIAATGDIPPVYDDYGHDLTKAVLSYTGEPIITNQEYENSDRTPQEVKDMLPRVRHMNNMVANAFADYMFAGIKQILEYNTEMTANMISEARNAGRKELCHVVGEAVEECFDFTEDAMQNVTNSTDEKFNQVSKALTATADALSMLNNKIESKECCCKKKGGKKK